jgi:hypothetical protein
MHALRGNGVVDRSSRRVRDRGVPTVETEVVTAVNYMLDERCAGALFEAIR